MRDASRRRIGCALAGALLVFFCYFPRSYVARVELAPHESSVGLNAVLSGGANGLNLGALLGQPQSIQGDVAIGRSHAVAQDAIKKLRLVERGVYHDTGEAEVELSRKVDVEAVHAALLQIRIEDYDPVFAREVAVAYSEAIRARFAALSLSQVVRKRALAENRLSMAQMDLARDQAALEAFREVNNLAVPEAQFGAAVVQLSLLQARLQAKQVQLSTLSQFATDDNVEVRAVRAEIDGLQASIAHAQRASAGAASTTLAAMSQRQSTYLNLMRNERYRQFLVDIFSQYLQSVDIDKMTVGDNIELIEPVYVEPGRRINVWAEGLLFALALVAGAAEFYIPRPVAGSLGRVTSPGGVA
jgi:tyrosine-protein kinase Etk/Wzc